MDLSGHATSKRGCGRAVAYWTTTLDRNENASRMGSATRGCTALGDVFKTFSDFVSEGLIWWEKMALRKITLGRLNFLTRTLPFDDFFLVSSPEDVGS